MCVCATAKRRRKQAKQDRRSRKFSKRGKLPTRASGKK